MTESEWNTWLEQVPDVEIDRFEETVYTWASDCECGDDMKDYCVRLTKGNNPRKWLAEAYDTITLCCLDEEETGEFLVLLYKEVILKLSLS